MVLLTSLTLMLYNGFIYQHKYTANAKKQPPPTMAISLALATISSETNNYCYFFEFTDVCAMYVKDTTYRRAFTQTFKQTKNTMKCSTLFRHDNLAFSHFCFTHISVYTGNFSISNDVRIVFQYTYARVLVYMNVCECECS